MAGGLGMPGGYRFLWFDAPRCLWVALTLALVVFPLSPAQAAGDPVLVGAGDISSCNSLGDARTAALLDKIPGTVFTLGDNAYGSGTRSQFEDCYHPTWGRHRWRTRPALGNHDQRTKGSRGYFAYFGKNAGPPDRGYYSYDRGAWHIVVLNSNCVMRPRGCEEGSPQVKWLRADLAANSKKCTLAYWHHTRWSSARNHGNDPGVASFWRALYDYGAEVVLSAHDHVYERFFPQTPDGRADPHFGIRQFVVGTGGATHYRFGAPKPNSQVRNADTWGVLQLTLHDGSFDWRFVPEAGRNFRDSGSGKCHGRPDRRAN
jgi:hypothetical protein